MMLRTKDIIVQLQHGNVPEGYKKTKAGVMPHTWHCYQIRDCLNVRNNERKPISEEVRKTIPGDYPYFGPTQAQGYIATYESEGPAVLIGEDGDHFLKYKEREMTMYIDGKYTVNNHAHMLSGTDLCNVKWFYYAYQHKSLSDVITRQGAGRYKLTKEALEKLSLQCPPCDEQIKIITILTTQDKVIELQEKLIAEKQQQKKYLMQQLLTGKKRLPGFDVPWNTVELDEVFDYAQPTPFLVKSVDYSDEYHTPVLTAGKTFILGYTNEIHGIFVDLPVVIFDDFTTASKYVDFPFKAKSSAMKILKIKKGYNIIFAYNAMQLIKYVIAGHERNWISKYSKLTIDVPEIDEQNAIADIITAADREIDLLQQDLKQERQKKKALMQLLLTGIVRVNL